MAWVSPSLLTEQAPHIPLSRFSARLSAPYSFVAEDAGEGFRELSRDAAEDLERRTGVAYTADAELGRGEAFVLDDDEDLAELSDLTSLEVAKSTAEGSPAPAATAG